MSTHVLSYAVEGIVATGADDLAKVSITCQVSYFPGRTHSVLYVPDEVAQTMRLHDLILVTIEVPDDDEPVDPDPEDAPVPEFGSRRWGLADLERVVA